MSCLKYICTCYQYFRSAEQQRMLLIVSNWLYYLILYLIHKYILWTLADTEQYLRLQHYSQEQEQQQAQLELEIEQQQEELERFEATRYAQAMPEVLAGTPTHTHNKANSGSMMSSVRLNTISPTLSINGSSNEASNCKWQCAAIII